MKKLKHFAFTTVAACFFVAIPRNAAAQVAVSIERSFFIVFHLANLYDTESIRLAHRKDM